MTELVDQFLATHEVDPATTEKLLYELKHATREFGDKRLDQLRTPDLAAWRATLPARLRHQLFRSNRQVLEQAVTSIAAELIPAYRALPVFLVGTGCAQRRRSRSSGETSTKRTESLRSSGFTRRAERSRA